MYILGVTRLDFKASQDLRVTVPDGTVAHASRDFRLGDDSEVLQVNPAIFAGGRDFGLIINISQSASESVGVILGFNIADTDNGTPVADAEAQIPTP